MLITSKNNEIIKNAIKLNDKKFRDKTGKFLVESEKVINEAIKSGYEVQMIFCDVNSNFNFDASIKIVEVPTNILKLLSSSVTAPKCVAVVCKKDDKSAEIKSNFLVLDRVQDPSNVGAIIRSALGAGFNNVLLIDCADVYDGKVIRSSMGAIFNVNIQKVSLKDVVSLSFPLVIMDMNGENVFNTEFKDNEIYGFVVGNEGQGVSKDLKQIAFKTVSIPMNDKLESLNASVSASIVMYTISRNLKEC